MIFCKLFGDLTKCGNIKIRKNLIIMSGALILASIPTRNELICMMLTLTKNTDPTVDIPINNLASTGRER